MEKPKAKLNPKIDIARAVGIMGRQPINEPGTCFETSIRQVLMPPDHPPAGLILCHGIGIANFPGQEGCVMAHAWLEWGDFAYDSTWGVKMSKWKYREICKLSYIITYKPKVVLRLWKKHGMPGPWDSKIAAVCRG